MGNVLWMVNHYAGLPHEPHGTRHYWLGRGLQELGWDVRIIRSGPTNTGRPWRPLVEDVGGIEVTTIPGPPTDLRGLPRVLSWAEFTGLLHDPRSTNHLAKPDVVLGSTVHLGAAWAARHLAVRHGVRFVFEVRDLWPETLIALGVLKRRSAQANAMLRIERSLARSAALIISPLRGVGRYMAEHHGIPDDKFVWVSNGVNLDSYSAVPSPAGAGLRLQYFGAIGIANDVSSIVDAVGAANEQLDDPVHLQIRGTGSERESLVERVAKDPDLSSAVMFLPSVPSTQVPTAMAWGNALVLVVRDLPDLYRYGIGMNKMFDYLAGGRWIILGSRLDDTPVKHAPGISQCDPSARSMSNAIVEVARMGARQRDSIAAGNSDLARDCYDYRVLANRLSTRLSGTALGG